MSEHHFVRCDQCGREDDTEFNGEHWLPPKNWAILCDNEFSTKPFDLHLCPNCVIVLSKALESEEENCAVAGQAGD